MEDAPQFCRQSKGKKICNKYTLLDLNSVLQKNIAITLTSINYLHYHSSNFIDMEIF